MISIYFAHEVPSKCFCGAFRLVIVLFISQGGRNFFVCLIVMANNSSGNNILLAAAAGALVGTGFGLLVGGRLGRGHGGGGAVIFDQEAIERVVSKYPRVKSAGVFKYGTAGFRMKEELLDSTCVRMGMLAVLRAMRTGVPVGIMVTASHNGPADNGLKMTDHDGGMLAASWEGYATQLANAEESEVFTTLVKILDSEDMSSCYKSLEGCVRPQVFLGMDTRTHSPRLIECCRLGISVLGAKVTNIGIVTTPQLHHQVYTHNHGLTGVQSKWADLSGYYKKVDFYFRGLLRSMDKGTLSKARGPLLIDCANGVGAPQMLPLVSGLKDVLEIHLRNTGDGELNSGCGAEHVQKKRLPPVTFDEYKDRGLRVASFDGDADRVVYWYFRKEDGQFRLLDGDKIAVLTARWINKQLLAAGYKEGEINMGIVQTAYANGAASAVVKADGIAAPYAKTGVKYLHHKALAFDIGVYYEANGHGTVLFADDTITLFCERMNDDVLTEAQREANRSLYYASQLHNQAVGDAICDALFVEAILSLEDHDVVSWDALYVDLPSRQTKVRVADRTVLTTVDDETRLLTPATLQTRIDAAVRSVKCGRAFARPSGTEDVCRVYAEAASQDEADKLAANVACAIFEEAAGVGAKPEQWW
jgi:phosphoacetylglucosamine mutase